MKNTQYTHQVKTLFDVRTAIPVEFKELLLTQENEDLLVYKLASLGEIESQFELGENYANAKCSTFNQEKAEYWLTKAAEGGCQEYQWRLGIAYASVDFDIISYDSDRAIYWMSRAATQGDPWYQGKLGTMYSSGEEIPQNFEKAIFWLTKAAEQKETDFEALENETWELFEYELWKLYAEVENYDEAVYWLGKSHKEILALYMSGLGDSFAKGIDGTPKDTHKAVYWLTKGAELGGSQDKRQLAERYANGNGVPFDLKKAAYWFTQEAEQSKSGYSALGERFAYGVPQDVNMAIHWLEQAVEAENEGSNRLLILWLKIKRLFTRAS